MSLWQNVFLLTPGAKLGPYEILSLLGSGGMGEVYRARDTKLNRDVAIKVLPASVAEDRERMLRFEREAQTLASLNHPNIAQIYGMERAALVMELVPGETLAGPKPLDEAIAIAGQIAEALEAAHEKGIIHRDLKPANIKITPDGVVKVLDFGLAKALGDSPAADASNSPTLSLAATQAGLILGTAAYMSPEQARGKGADRRSDIFSFGVVFLETLTGKRAFEGEMLSDVLAAVMRDQPVIPPDLPPNIARLLRRCLEKDPKRRLQAIGEARIALEPGAATEPIGQMTGPAAGSAAAPSAPVIPAATPTPKSRSSAFPWVVAGVALALAAALSWKALRATAPATPLMRFDALLAPDALSGTSYFAAYATISPDGTRVLYSTRSADQKPMIGSRVLDRSTGSIISGTENGSDPIFSPDGQWIAFFADNKLRKVSINGGASVALADAANPRGAAWLEDGTIVAELSNTSGLVRLPASGGAIQTLTQLRSGEATHRWPQALPGGQSVLFTVCDNLSNYENSSLDVVNVKSGERTTVVRGGYFGRYTPSGHLLYIHEGVLFAMAVSDARSGSPMKALGAPAPVLDDVASLSNSGSGQFDFSQNGVFLYHSGKAKPEWWPLGTIDSAGKNHAYPQLSQSGAYFTPRYSPDGRRIVLGIEHKGLDSYVYDVSRDVLTRLTFTSQLAYQQVWTPDGEHIVTRNTAGDENFLYWIRSDGVGGVQTLASGKNVMTPNSFSPNGTILAYAVRNTVNWDVWTMPLDLANPDHPKVGTPTPFLQSAANERDPAFSPDGRWMAYSSDESGTSEVYVRPFPGAAGSGKWQISTGGGRWPVWLRKGSKLFFESLDNRILAVDYTVKGDSFLATKARPWAKDLVVNNPTIETNYDVAPDGTRLLALLNPERKEAEKGPVIATFLLGFFDELRRRAPAGK